MKIKFFYFDASKYTKHNYSNSTNIIRSYDLLDAPKNLKEVYLDAQKAYESNDLLQILSICDRLKISYDISNDEFDLIRNQIEQQM